MVKIVPEGGDDECVGVKKSRKGNTHILFNSFTLPDT